MRGILEKLEGEVPLRTLMVEGDCFTPRVGRRFQMLAPPLNPGPDVDTRLIETTPVTSSVETWHPEDGPGFLFTTQSGSHYRLTVLR
jgi:hypothetical protein